MSKYGQNTELDNELKRLARELAADKITEAGLCLELDKLTTDYCPPGTESERLRRSLERTVKRLALGSKTHKKKEPEFNMGQAELAAEIRESKHPADKLVEYLKQDGYIVSPLLAQMMLLISGFRKINPVTWKKTGSLKGTQTMLYGSHGSGKTEFFDKLLYINDADSFYPNGVVFRIGRTSGLGLLFNAGSDGKRFQHQIVAHEELGPESPAKQLIWATTTAGRFTNISSGENRATGQRQGAETHMEGPIHHLFTTVSPPSEFDSQFISRTIRIEFNLNAETREQIVRMKVTDRKGGMSPEESYDQAKAWNLFLHELKCLDPGDKHAYADIDMSEISGHLNSIVDTKMLGDDDPRRIDIMWMLIASHALIHQHYRETRNANGQEILIATPEDLNGVVEAFNKFVPPTAKTVTSADSVAFRQLARELKKVGPMSRDDIKCTVLKCDRTVSSYLKSWKAAGLLVVAESGIRGEHHFGLGPTWDKAAREITKVEGDLNIAMKKDAVIEQVIDRALEITDSRTVGFRLSPMSV